jgi:hypothetical protein
MSSPPVELDDAAQAALRDQLDRLPSEGAEQLLRAVLGEHEAGDDAQQRVRVLRVARQDSIQHRR